MRPSATRISRWRISSVACSPFTRSSLAPIFKEITFVTCRGQTSNSWKRVKRNCQKLPRQFCIFRCFTVHNEVVKYKSYAWVYIFLLTAFICRFYAETFHKICFWSRECLANWLVKGELKCYFPFHCASPRTLLTELSILTSAAVALCFASMFCGIADPSKSRQWFVHRSRGLFGRSSTAWSRSVWSRFVMRTFTKELWMKRIVPDMRTT